MEVLKALLFCSTTENDFWLPINKRLMLKEIVNATIEYIGGNPEK